MRLQLIGAVDALAAALVLLESVDLLERVGEGVLGALVFVQLAPFELLCGAAGALAAAALLATDAGSWRQLGERVIGERHA